MLVGESEFPKAQADDWCGEFVRALPADIEARKKKVKRKKPKRDAKAKGN